MLHPFVVLARCWAADPRWRRVLVPLAMLTLLSLVLPAIGLADQGPDDWLPTTPEKLMRLLFCIWNGFNHRIPIADVWDCLQKP